MFSFLKKLFASTDYKALLAKDAIIIDVRTAQEFDGGHIPQAKNIPLHILPHKLKEITNKNVPIICCCASGMRSAQAAKHLKSAGIEAYNGGGWSSLLRKIN